MLSQFAVIFRRWKVIAIFNSGFSSSVATVGNANCDAVTSVPLADGPGDHKPRVNGVIVKGKFIRYRLRG